MLLSGNLVFALNQTTRIVLRRYVTKPHIAQQGAKERNSGSNEHGHTSDHQPLHQPCAQKSLNRDSSVDIDVVSFTSRECRNDLSWRPGHLFHHPSAHR